MILEPGSKTLIVHRRLFDTDGPRYFVGQVDAYEQGIARISGHTWIVDQLGGTFFKKPDIRTKIVSLTSGAIIAYQLPSDTDLVSVRFERTLGKLVLADGKELRMDLSESEHPPSRRR